MTTATCALSVHQYIDRATGDVVTERPIGDQTIAFLYNRLRENAPAIFRILTSSRMSSLLAYCHYDLPGKNCNRDRMLFERLGIDIRECVEPLSHFTSMRRILNGRSATGIVGR